MKTKTIEQQKAVLAAELKGIGSRLAENEKLILAGSVPMALNSLKTYLAGGVAKTHTAENIINKAKELFPAVAA